MRLFPAEHRIEAVDTVTLSEPVGKGQVFLNPDLENEIRWLDDRSFKARYAGFIDYPLRNIGEEYARGQKDTAGSIGPEGVYLDIGSGWYPVVRGKPDDKITFDLTVQLPPGWDAVSQGTRTGHTVKETGTVVRWVCEQPQDAIWLVAGQYHQYAERFGEVQAQAFFRKPEEDLAAKYLQATGEYIGMYEKLIGKYPYGKFALVENFWETGYGMPSFTLLGPRVIRFPFIIESSYPHEILHNWWGNSVYIDYGSGNWGEGLTAYLSDHLIKEQKGLGSQHRQEVLQKYADYVLEGRDIPLTQFRSRHGSVTEAVGYGKTMMLFHMLRMKLGEDLFREGLQRLYKDNLYKAAGFREVREAFEVVSDRDLDNFFQQWVERTGAPELVLADLKVNREDSGVYRVDIAVEQVQEGEPYSMVVPVAVTLQGQDEAALINVPLEGVRASVKMELPARPVRVDVDPRFDLFRRLDRREIPPALTQAFGARKALIVLPSRAEAPLLDSYRSLASFLSRTGPGQVDMISDGDLESLPADTSVWLLGWENLTLPGLFPAFEEYGLVIDVRQGTVKLPDETSPVFTRLEHSVVLTGRHPLNSDLAVLWIGAANTKAHEGLARKLPHYHKYSYLAFDGDEPENVARGRWPVVGSPLTGFPGGSSGPMGTLREREPLVERPVPFSGERMMKDIRFLASEGLKGRGNGSAELQQAARYIARMFEEAGLEAGGEGGTWFRDWDPGGGKSGETLKNVVGILPGTESAWKGQSLIVGAHYDHLGLGLGEGGLSINRGRVHPGADDNASGVAVMMELARVFAAGPRPKRTIVFTSFAGEESRKLGSARYVSDPGPYPLERAMGMINLDTVGRLADGKLLVLGGDSAAEWIHIFRGAGYVAGVDLQVVTKPLDASDHVTFIDAGVPAVQLFTGAHEDYHRPTDTVEKIDRAGLVKVAQVAKEAIGYLASREDPLTGSGEGERESGGRGDKTSRKVSLGTIPDFAYEGEGVSLDGTVKGSPAEKAGLMECDVIKGINGKS
ncbi:MAG: M20/M25/M40 family metallo-hydrolase, partial [bacterium]